MDRALRWLADRQGEDGAWREDGRDVSGVVLLAFTGAGHSHEDAAVRKAMTRVLSLQRDDGRIGDTALAFALLEDYALTRSPMLADHARRAVESVSRSWDPGEWGVQMRRAARKAGFMCEWRETIEEDPARRLASRYLFQPGLRDFVAADALLRDLPKTDFRRWHHGTVALYLIEGPTGPKWTHWEYEMKKAILPLQDPDGSWGGRVEDTAINALTLDTPRRFYKVFGR